MQIALYSDAVPVKPQKAEPKAQTKVSAEKVSPFDDDNSSDSDDLKGFNG